MFKYVIFFLTGASLAAGFPAMSQPTAVDTAYLSAVKKELNAVWPGNRTINLVFHGHSVPAGYGDRHLVHTLDAYPQRLLARLKAQYPYAVINVIVTAIGGEHSVAGAARFNKEVLAHQPDVLFIDYALNDRSPGLEKAREAWGEMIKAALKQHVKVILLTPSPDQRVNLLEPGNPLEQHARQIRQLAASYHIGIADPYARFVEIARAEGGVKAYMASVNHPNRKGHEVIADELMRWFIGNNIAK